MGLLDVDVLLRRGHVRTEKRQKHVLNVRVTQCRAYYIEMSTDVMKTNMLSNEDIKRLGAKSVSMKVIRKECTVHNLNVTLLCLNVVEANNFFFKSFFHFIF